jgi:hypothetical protein
MKQAGRLVGRRDSKPRRPKCASRIHKDPACASSSVIVHDGFDVACSGPAHNNNYLHVSKELVSWDSWEQNRTCSDCIPNSDLDILCLDEALSEQATSVDERLFDWELGLDGGSMSDPFEADWLEPA